MSIPIIENENLHGYVRVPIDHPFTNMASVRVDDVLDDHYNRFTLNASISNVSMRNMPAEP